MLKPLSNWSKKHKKWKQEIETKKIEINKIKALTAEKPLLTKGLRRES
jgi:hypothetical protein